MSERSRSEAPAPERPSLVLVKLPENLREMSRAEIEAWARKVDPEIVQALQLPPAPKS